MKPTYSAFRTRHSGFTLVELLVVIGIIAALASLLVVAGSAAINATREASIKTEAGLIADGFTAYTNDVSSGAYPPNLCVDSPADPVNDFTRHFNKAFPQHREPKALIAVLANGVTQGDYTMNGTAGIGVTPYEAIPFWIGGFSSDPKYPISGPGGPSFITNSGGTDQTNEDFGARAGFDFNEPRLGPRNSNNEFDGRYVTYPDPQNSSTIRRINLWWYYPTNVTKPFAYFDASNTPKGNIVFPDILPIPVAKLNASGNLTVRDIRLANEGKCQILAVGLDDAWGNLAEIGVPWANKTANNTAILYPDGPFTGELADTITNFSTGRTLEDSQP